MKYHNLQYTASACALVAFMGLSSAQSQLLYLPFNDAEGTPFNSSALVAGVASYSDGSSTIKAASALTYPTLVSTGNGYGTLQSNRSNINLDVSPSGPFAPYVSGGLVGGVPGIVLYFSFMVKGATSGSSSALEFRNTANPDSCAIFVRHIWNALW